MNDIHCYSSLIHLQLCLMEYLDFLMKQSTEILKFCSLGNLKILIYLVHNDLKIEYEFPLLKGSVWESITYVFVLIC